MDKAIKLDNILRRFKGNATIRWEDLRTEFKTDEDDKYLKEYFIIENNIKFLLGENVLMQANNETSLQMTNKGFAIYADIETLGYVAQQKEYEIKKRVDKWTFILVLIGTIAAILGIILSLYK